MDRLIIMDEGRIVEQGTHADLLRRGGLYAELWARQSGGFLAQDAAE
jgi:ATP-binding cassette subfamily B multidrug efflux pump